jgi:uncharacterized linocin/CFP29 family protein
MDLLKRDLAPITPEAWEQIDAEAKRVLLMHLAGRKLVDVDGPHGWKHAAVNVGTLDIKKESGLGVPWGVRCVIPLIELRQPFELAMMEIDNASRGAVVDLSVVVKAAEAIAHAEEEAIFNGFKAGGIEGIIPSSPHAAISIPANYAEYPSVVVEAAEILRQAGVNGPYALALGPQCYNGLAQAAEDGYPIRERLHRIVEGPIVWAPKIDGAVMLSTRGGDFQLTVGQDLSIGYEAHEKNRVRLYLTESFTFRVLEHAAAVHLKPQAKGRR